jgi:hypothetical protein
MLSSHLPTPVTVRFVFWQGTLWEATSTEHTLRTLVYGPMLSFRGGVGPAIRDRDKAQPPQEPPRVHTCPFVPNIYLLSLTPSLQHYGMRNRFGSPVRVS